MWGGDRWGKGKWSHQSQSFCFSLLGKVGVRPRRRQQAEVERGVIEGQVGVRGLMETGRC